MNVLQPYDDHNRALEQNVHPPSYVNPTPTGPYHLVVIGAGTAGLVAAAGAAGLGARIALIERDLMGGDCLNVGCVPSKGIISSARVAATAKAAEAYSVNVAGPIETDFAGVMQRMRQARAKISRADSAERYRKLGVDVYFGGARFTASDTVDVAGTTLRFKRAIVATGSRPAVPSIPGLDGAEYLTNESLFSLTQLPQRLGVIGAGPIGTEMAQAFAGLGAKVLLVESDHGILSKEDRDAAEIVQAAIEKDGVRVLCCGRDLHIAQEKGIHLRLDSHGTRYDEPVDQLLIATGRAPNTESLGLETVGVDYDDRGIQVDDYLQTTNPRIYAAGDVCGKFKFTHAADFMARAVIQNALFAVGPLGKKRMSDLVIPWATYTTPEVAHVGLYPHQADEQNIAIDTYVQSFEELDRAILEGEQEGFVKIHTKRGSDKILGATIVARSAGDLISQVTMAMTQGIGLGKIAGTIHPYPTQAEAIHKLGDQYNRTRLTPLNKSVLGVLRRWNAGT